MTKTLLVLALGLTILTSSCNPIKRVLKDPEKTQVMADEIIRRGYCVNDTTISISTDTVTIDSIVYVADTFELETGCFIDTILPSGTRIVVVDGKIAVREKQKVIVKTVTNTVANYIRDVAKENLLIKDLKFTEDSLHQAEAQVKVVKDMNKTLQKKVTKLYLSWAAFIALVLLYFVVRIYLRIAPKL